MQIPVSINAQGCPLTDTMESEIRRLADELGRLFDRIITCRISVSRGHDRRDDTRFDILIDLHLPWGHVNVHGRPDRQLATAVQDAFRKARTFLERYRGRRPETPAVHPPATIDFLDPDRGYGYIRTWNDRRLWFDRSSVMGDGFPRLHQGMAVRFLETVEGGQPHIQMLSPI